MKFLKKLGKALLGSSKSRKTGKSFQKAPKKGTAQIAQKKVTKSAKKRLAKKAAPRSEGKTAKKKAASKKPTVMVKEALAALPIAEVTHYFPHVNAAVLKIKVGTIRVGDKLHFKGHTTNFTQKVASMQIDHQPVLIARKGDDFGVEVQSRVRAGDRVTKI